MSVSAVNEEATRYEAYCRAVDYHVRAATGVAPCDYPPQVTTRIMRTWFTQDVEVMEAAASIVHEIVKWPKRWEGTPG